MHAAAGRVVHMGEQGKRGRRSKGDRVAIFPVLPPEVLEHTRLEADRLGIALSEYIADVMAVTAGRLDLVQHTAPENLPVVAMTSPPPRHGRFVAVGTRVTTRLAKPVVERIQSHCRDSGVANPISAYVVHTLTLAVHAPLLDVDDQGQQSAHMPATRLMPIQEVLLAV